MLSQSIDIAEARDTFSDAIELYRQVLPNEFHPRLEAFTIRITDFEDQLAGAFNDVIWIDEDGSGLGWWTESQFDESSNEQRYDLLTVAMHEIGHLLGVEHSLDPDDLMFERIGPNTSKSIPLDIVDRIFSDVGDHH